MKAFSNDLRVRVIREKSAGHSVKETWKYEALPIPGAKRKLCEEDKTFKSSEQNREDESGFSTSMTRSSWAKVI